MVKTWLVLLLIISTGIAFGQSIGTTTLLGMELDSILKNDQKYRIAIDTVVKKYGYQSDTIKNIWKVIKYNDSINLNKVEAILDRYGWLGSDEVGQDGSTALWAVIQHSSLKVQEKYLPMMKAAVNKGKASASELALLEDRVEVRNGRPQIYGSQVDTKDGENSFYPILDEKNVNKRRAEVGLQPLEDYAKLFGIEYKLPDR